MLLRKFCAVIFLSLLFILGQVEIVKAGQPPAGKQGPEVVTETFRVMGKGADYIVIGEQHLYVVPEITKITSSYGTAIELKGFAPLVWLKSRIAAGSRVRNSCRLSCT